MRQSKRAKWKSVKIQFSLYMICLSGILVILCFTLIHEARESVLKNAIQYSEHNCEVFRTSLDQIAMQADAVFTRLQYDKTCMEVMKLESPGKASPELIRDLGSLLSTIDEREAFFEDITLCTDQILYSDLYLRNDLECIAEKVGDRHGTVSLGVYEPLTYSAKSPASFLVFGCNYFSGYEKLGNIVISVNLTALPSGLPTLWEEGFYYAMVGEEQEICFLGVNKKEEEQNPDYEMIRSLLKEGEGSELKNGRFLFQKLSVKNASVSLVGIIDKDAVTVGTDAIYAISSILVVFLLAVYLICNFSFHKNVVSPLDRLSHYIAALQNEDILSAHEEKGGLELAGCEEISMIGKEFAKLLTYISNLSAEIRKKKDGLYQVELQRKNAEIENLRSQINPHFLYNTLELIRADAIAGKSEQVSQIIEAMGKMYRYAIKGSSLVTLNDEILVVKAYITIQQFRYHNRIQTIYNISGETSSVKIPKMILQPLVENAFVHGLEAQEGKGMLFIGASMENGIIRITVRDNGKGIEAEELERVRARLKDRGSSDSIGIANVYTRLKLQYGENCDFSITSEAGDGTCILIVIRQP